MEFQGETNTETAIAVNITYVPSSLAAGEVSTA